MATLRLLRPSLEQVLLTCVLSVIHIAHHAMVHKMENAIRVKMDFSYRIALALITVQTSNILIWSKRLAPCAIQTALSALGLNKINVLSAMRLSIQ